MYCIIKDRRLVDLLGTLVRLEPMLKVRRIELHVLIPFSCVDMCTDYYVQSMVNVVEPQITCVGRRYVCRSCNNANE